MVTQMKSVKADSGQLINMLIRLKTLKDVHEFSEKCSLYDGDIYLQQGRYVVNGRSIMGIYSMNLLEPLKVTIESFSKLETSGFYEEMGKWKYEENCLLR